MFKMQLLCLKGQLITGLNNKLSTLSAPSQWCRHYWEPIHIKSVFRSIFRVTLQIKRDVSPATSPSESHQHSLQDLWFTVQNWPEPVSRSAAADAANISMPAASAEPSYTYMLMIISRGCASCVPAVLNDQTSTSASTSQFDEGAGWRSCC